MKGYEKYERSYFLPPECTYDWVKKDYSYLFRVHLKCLIKI